MNRSATANRRPPLAHFEFDVTCVTAKRAYVSYRTPLTDTSPALHGDKHRTRGPMPSHFAENGVTMRPVFGSLESAKMLAMADGYTVIYDPRNH